MDNFKTFDALFHSGKNLEKVTDDFVIDYVRYNGKWPVGDRDFVCATNVFKLENGDIA